MCILFYQQQNVGVISGKAGRKTLLLEKKKFPRDKYCGDAVCKTAIEILDEMGLYQQLLDEDKAKIVSTDTAFCIVQLYNSENIELFKGQWCQLVTLCHPGLTYIFNFWHSGTLALRAEHQSARMSEIKNVG